MARKTGDEDLRTRRLRKQAEYQRAYRRKQAELKMPLRDDVANALLYVVVRDALRNAKALRLLDEMKERVLDNLVAQGFGRATSRVRFEDIVDRCEDGWAPQRKIRGVPASSGTKRKT